VKAAMRIVDGYKSIKEKPSQDGNYLVKFYNRDMPKYDCTEIVFREFRNGEWVHPIYNYPGDGYELVGWYEK